MAAGPPGDRIDGVVARLPEARDAGGYNWVTSPFFLDLALRGP